MEVGDKVSYIKGNGNFENRIVKSIQSEKFVFVVYNCAGEWDNYQNYTAARTDKSQLVMGWRE